MTADNIAHERQQRGAGVRGCPGGAPVTVAGESFGGPIALKLAAVYPDAVQVRHRRDTVGGTVSVTQWKHSEGGCPGGAPVTVAYYCPRRYTQVLLVINSGSALRRHPLLFYGSYLIPVVPGRLYDASAYCIVRTPVETLLDFRGFNGSFKSNTGLNGLLKPVC